jgi:hypothetical protein
MRKNIDRSVRKLVLQQFTVYRICARVIFYRKSKVRDR